jgi:formylglycine-generating enzyme
VSSPEGKRGRCKVARWCRVILMPRDTSMISARARKLGGCLLSLVLAHSAGQGAMDAQANARAAMPADPRSCISRHEMVYVPAGKALLGEDGPSQPGSAISMEGFWIDRYEVTNRQFARFVQQTGYRTQAERDGRSAVFAPRTPLVDLTDASQWWGFVDGASWQRPDGPTDSIDTRMDEPVVHVTYEDALVYAKWLGHGLPNDAQWERAARAGQIASREPMQWAYDQVGKPRANTWQGVFPIRNDGTDGYAGVAPVGSFAPNPLGIYDMIGNVWEWTSSTVANSGVHRLIKGGSYLCARDYCANFRPAAWQAQERDLATSHIGFRTISATAPACGQVADKVLPTRR